MKKFFLGLLLGCSISSVYAIERQVDKQVEKIIDDFSKVNFVKLKTLTEDQKADLNKFKTEKSLVKRFELIEKFAKESSGEVNDLFFKSVVEKNVERVLSKLKLKEQSLGDNVTLNQEVIRKNDNILVKYKFATKKDNKDDNDKINKISTMTAQMLVTVQCVDLPHRLWVKSGKKITVENYLNNNKLSDQVLEDRSLCDKVEADLSKNY